MLIATYLCLWCGAMLLIGYWNGQRINRREAADPVNEWRIGIRSDVIRPGLYLGLGFLVIALCLGALQLVT